MKIRGAAGPLDVDALYASHQEQLLLYLARRTANVEIALDIWAETFAQVVAGRHRYRGQSEAEAAGWLYGIAKRQLALYYRRGVAERRALDRLGLERPAANEEMLAEIERRAALDVLKSELQVALKSLSEPIRSAVHLRIVDELPYDEIARTLEISEPTARARVSRGLSRLATVLDRPAFLEATSP